MVGQTGGPKAPRNPERKKTMYKLSKGFIMNSYIKENFDTGFLTPGINFAIFCASFALGALGIIFGAYL
jgi:hypothetical protein